MMRPSFLRLNKALVFAELNQGKCIPGFLSTLTAASKVGYPITACVVGEGSDAAANEIAKLSGVSSVLKLNHDSFKNPTASALVPLIKRMIKDGSYTHFFATSTALGRDVVPRLAATLDVMPISDIIDVIDPSTFKRGTYAGNALTVLKTSDAIRLVTVRAASFDKATVGDAVATITDAVLEKSSEGTVWLKDIVETSDKVDLTAASVVISGGRGLKNGDNFKLLYEFAKPLKAAVGATRAVVDAGYVPNDMQIGQTGKIVAPDVYFAVGLSGAIQHLAGMKDSKVICAINSDAEAPIFSVSDVGLVGDLFDAVPKLTQLVSKA